MAPADVNKSLRRDCLLTFLLYQNTNTHTNKCHCGDLVKTGDGVLKTYGDIVKSVGDLKRTNGDLWKVDGVSVKSVGDLMKTDGNFKRTDCELVVIFGYFYKDRL